MRTDPLLVGLLAAACFTSVAGCSLDFDKSDGAHKADAATQPPERDGGKDGGVVDGAMDAPQDVCGNQIDDDRDGKVDEGVPEECNGIDDDCDGVVDVDLVRGAPQCAGDSAVSCTTSCGSAGMGKCTASCELPTGSDCEAPVENLCNRADEDCDGLVDEGLTNRNAVDTILQYPSGSHTFAQVAMTPRAAGGFNLFQRAWNVAMMTPGAIAGYQVLGGVSSAAGSVASKTTDVRNFVADGDGEHTALFERIVVNTDKPALRVQLFSANDLSFVSEFVPTETKMALTKDNVVPIDVAITRSANGDTHVLLVYTTYNDTGAVSKTKFRVLHRTVAGLWSASSEVTIADSAFNTLGVHVEHIPCREDFLISYKNNTTFETRRVLASSGVFSGVNLYSLAPGTDYVVGLAGASKCSSAEASEMLIAFEVLSVTYLQHLAIAPDGAVSALGESVDLGTRTFSVSAVKDGGRWFVAGTPNGEGPALWEHALDVNGNSTLRAIPLLNVSDPKNANPGVLGGYASLWSSRSSVMVDDGNVYALFPNGDFEPGNKLVSAYTAQTGSAPANTPSAVMYRVGCP